MNPLPPFDPTPEREILRAVSYLANYDLYPSDAERWTALARTVNTLLLVAMDQTNRRVRLHEQRAVLLAEEQGAPK